MITKRTGILRVLYATYYSLKGLRAAFLSEAAVRQEIFAILIMTPVAFFHRRYACRTYIAGDIFTDSAYQ